MLPINQKHALHIPHGVAIVAAAICLVLAFSTDIQSRHAQITAERAEPLPVVAPAALLAGSEDSLPEQSARADQRRDPRTRDSGGRRAPMPLFPWVPGLSATGE